LWSELSESGRGTEYWRLVRAVSAKGGWPIAHVQIAICGLVLIGKAYCMPAHSGGTSLVGRGPDPRVGQHVVRTGAMGGMAA
jgi:hypothetical protein